MMIKVEVNKKLLPMKLNYFFNLGSLGPIYGFLPTIARQLGYSIKTYGTTMMAMSILHMMMSPTIGVIFDKYRVKRKMFLLSIALLFFDLILFMFIPKITSESAAELICDSRVVLRVNNDDNHDNSIFTEQNLDELITCKLNCQDAKLDSLGICNQSGISENWPITTVNALKNVYDRSGMDVTLTFNDMEYSERSYDFHVLSIQINDTILQPTTCRSKFKTICEIDCSNSALMDEATVKTYRQNVLVRPQFWIFAVAVFVFTISIAVNETAQNTICLDILENRTEDFGRQRCWGSIGWGFFSIFIGWLVDVFSVDKNEKNYSPVFYSAIILTVLNLFVSAKIQVKETNKSKGKLKSIYGLCSKHYTIVFYIWLLFMSLFHTILTHFLFWYMEDLVSENNLRGQKTWLKTLQGLAQCVQCFCGEIPFYFWSGWIIRRIGHVNSMALSLGAMAVRMYLYTIISNPVWIILIELLNGVSHSLAFAVRMSYAKLISPPDVLNTMIGILCVCDYIGESLGSVLGGYLFDAYGGLWSFRLFAYTSTLMCFLNIMSNIFGLTKEMKNDDFVAVPVQSSINMNDLKVP